MKLKLARVLGLVANRLDPPPQFLVDKRFSVGASEWTTAWRTAGPDA